MDPGDLRAELGEHPYDPITPASRRRADESATSCRSSGGTATSATPRSSPRRTPSVADLIGDVDPMKVAEGRPLGDPETIHFGLIPRSHRGIVAINELPDLAERIQVAMLNVMEERDIQIRGYVLRLPLDMLVVASANPEDYTNRGRIITPLKDRFGAEIRTHYPTQLEDEISVIRQEADPHRRGARPPGRESSPSSPQPPRVVARSTSAARQRLVAIAGAETIAASARHRATRQGEDEAAARAVDLETAVEVLAATRVRVRRTGIEGET